MDYTTIIVAVITFLASYLAAKQTYKAAIKSKEQEYLNAVRLKKFDIFHCHYVEYVHAVFNYIYNPNENTELEYRKNYAVMYTYSDFITNDSLDKIDELLANRSFDKALENLQNLCTAIGILSINQSINI